MAVAFDVGDQGRFGAHFLTFHVIDLLDRIGVSAVTATEEDALVGFAGQGFAAGEFIGVLFAHARVVVGRNNICCDAGAKEMRNRYIGEVGHAAQFCFQMVDIVAHIGGAEGDGDLLFLAQVENFLGLAVGGVISRAVFADIAADFIGVLRHAQTFAMRFHDIKERLFGELA